MHCHKDIAAYFGKFRMDEVTTPMVHQWFLKEQTRKTCSGKVIAPRTVNIARGYLHALFEFGRKIKEWNEKNPVSNVAPLKLPAPRNTFLREEDEQKFLAAIPDGGVRMTMKFAILTGLRKGEVVALKWEDVHMDTEPPYFTSKREKNGLVTDFPIVWQDLREVFDYFGNKAKEKTGQVFRNEKGEPITKDELYHGVTDASGKALTYHLQMNDLRRTFCSRLFWLGCNLTQVDYLMGHKTPGVNAHYRVYDLHNAAEELKRLEEVRNRRKAATKMTHQGGEEKE